MNYVDGFVAAVPTANKGKVMNDPRMAMGNNPMPFDGKRLIYGGFVTMLNEGG